MLLFSNRQSMCIKLLYYFIKLMASVKVNNFNELKKQNFLYFSDMRYCLSTSNPKIVQGY